MTIICYGWGCTWTIDTKDRKLLRSSKSEIKKVEMEKMFQN